MDITKFFNPNARSMPEQVVKNAADIADLQQKIKPIFYTKTSITSESTSINLTETNIPEADFESGFLVSVNGNVFDIINIVGGLVYLSFILTLQLNMPVSANELSEAPATKKINSLNYATSNRGVTYDSENGMKFYTDAKILYDDRTEDLSSATMTLPIQSSDSIVFDVSADNKYLTARIQPEILDKINSITASLTSLVEELSQK